MTIKCPHCGEICESDGDIPVGQHIECPFCANQFYYGKDTENLGDVSSAATLEANKEEMRFCGQCGAKISSTVSFCPRCGRNVLAQGHTAVEAKAEAVSSGDVTIAEAKGTGPEKFQKLLHFIKVSLILSAISAIIRCLDVKEYYFLGRGGAFVLGTAFLGIQIWLYVAVMQRKSWARKSFIVFTLMLAVFFVLGLQSGGGDNPIVIGLEVIENLIGLYCVYLCFAKEVVSVFKPDSELNDARAVVNTMHCFGYWIAFGLVIVVSIVWAFCHDGTDDWERDCEKAAVAGSSSAREKLIVLWAGRLEDQDLEDPVEIATELVDATIGEKSTKDEKTDSRHTSHSRPPTTWIILGGKILGKIAVGLAALIGVLNTKFKDFFSKLKNE